MTLLHLRPTAHRVVRGGRLVLGHRDRHVALAPYDVLHEDVLRLLATGVEEDALRRAVEDRHGRAGWARAEASLARLLDADIVRRKQAPPPLPGRYQRTLTYLSQYATSDVDEVALLSRLRDSVVTVVGVGGLGSWLLSGLACLGVGELRIVDFDVVEGSNLNRTLLVGAGDVGAPKLEAVSARLGELTEDTVVRSFPLAVGADPLPAEVVAGADVVLSTADKPAWVVRRAVALACLDAAVPFLCPAGFRVGPFHTAPGDACVLCDYTRRCAVVPGFAESVAEQQRVPASEPGSVPHIAAAVAGVVLQDTLRVLTGIEEPATRNRVWNAGWDLSATYQDVSPAPGCACR